MACERVPRGADPKPWLRTIVKEQLEPITRLITNISSSLATLNSEGPTAWSHTSDIEPLHKYRFSRFWKTYFHCKVRIAAETGQPFCTPASTRLVPSSTLVCSRDLLWRGLPEPPLRIAALQCIHAFAVRDALISHSSPPGPIIPDLCPHANKIKLKMKVGGFSKTYFVRTAPRTTASEKSSSLSPVSFRKVVFSIYVAACFASLGTRNDSAVCMNFDPFTLLRSIASCIASCHGWTSTIGIGGEPEYVALPPGP